MVHKDKSVKNIKLAFFLNLAFSLAEFIGGIFTNSMAILSDALHDLGDSLSLGVSWFLQKKSKEGGDSTYTFGHKRFSLLGALINGVVLLIGSVIILYEAIPRLMTPSHSNAQGMVWFALAGVIINGFAAVRLHKGKSLNEKVLSWHLLEDILGWVGILIISIIMLFKDIHILDPILSIAISGFVLFNVIRNLIKTVRVLLDPVPDNIDYDQIKNDILQLKEVKAIDSLHIWSIDGEEHAMMVNLTTLPDTSKEEMEKVKKGVKEVVSDMNIVFLSIDPIPNKEARQNA